MSTMMNCYCFLIVLVLFGVQCLAIPSYIVNPEDPEGLASIFKRAPGPKTACIKDLLIVWDHSTSVANYYNKMRTFIEGLLTNLDVGPDTTNVAIIVFSAKELTKIVYTFKDSQEKSDIFKEIRDPKNEHFGGVTSTGRALDLAATKVFTDSSPKNHREQYDDVLLLITEGAPTAYEQKDTDLYKKYDLPRKDRFEGLLLVDKLSTILKGRGVEMLGILIKISKDDPNYREKEDRKLRQNMEMWTDDYVPTTSKALDETVSNKIIDITCKGASCRCEDSIPGNGTVTPDQKTTPVHWEVPNITTNCKLNVKRKTTIPEGATPGDSFSKDVKEIIYSYELEGDISLRCHVPIQITECKCSKRTQKEKAYLPSGETAVAVTWDVPKPVCDNAEASYTSSVPKVKPGDRFSKSQILKYEYIFPGGVPLECFVDIEVVAVCQCPALKPSTTRYIFPGEKTIQITFNKNKFPPETHACRLVLPPKKKYGVGRDEQVYSYGDQKCPIEINVIECKCSNYDHGKPIVAYLPSGQQSVAVTWNVPTPSCSASLKLTNIVPNVKPGYRFSQSQSVKYEYRMVSGSSLTCSVDIEIKVCRCSGVHEAWVYVHDKVILRNLRDLECDMSYQLTSLKLKEDGKSDYKEILNSSSQKRAWSTPGKHHLLFTFTTEEGRKVQCKNILRVREKDPNTEKCVDKCIKS